MNFFALDNLHAEKEVTITRPVESSGDGMGKELFLKENYCSLMVELPV